MKARRTAEFDLPLSLLREQVARSDLLPKAYAHYRPLIADGLLFFLQRLSRPRLRRILTEQMHLSPSVSTAERVVALLAHLPALHKLGQVVARDRRLSKGFRRRLQQLESLAPQLPMSTVTRQLDRECADWRRAGVELEPQPLAEGSVAVVLPFTWREGRRPPRQGVFKLLKPGIQPWLEEDLEILSSLAAFLDERCDVYHFPALDYQETFHTIRQLLRHEVRLEFEQQHLAEAAALYSQVNAVVIPALLPFCSPRLTAMERLHGHRIPSSDSLSDGASRHGSARVIARALVAQPLFSAREAALFHADPHAGNLLILPEGRLGILDWSLTGRLPRGERAAIVQLMLGAFALDQRRMELALEQLALNHGPPSTVAAVLRSSLCELPWGAFPGIMWLTGLLDQLALRAGVRFPANLLLFRKSLLTLEGVLADLTGPHDTPPQPVLNAVVTQTYLHHCALEWPDRFLTPLAAKSPTTHLSTADLLSLAWPNPATVLGWWNQLGLDCLSRWRQGLASGVAPEMLDRASTGS